MNDYLFKIIIVGAASTGKTSLIKQYVQGIFSLNQKPTVGVDFASKSIQHNEKTDIVIQLWDIAGQERFESMTKVFYQNSVGGLVVFDASEKNTLEVARKWKKDIDSKAYFPHTSDIIPVILLANKIDLVDEESKGYTHQELDLICQECGFVCWFEVSAKENLMVEKSIDTLVEAIMPMVDQNFFAKKDLDNKNKKDKNIIVMSRDDEASDSQDCRNQSCCS